MGIRESLLNTITSVSNSDFVRIVTSAGVSSKATVQNLFKSFETGLGAKSSLTTSDYVRVVGSDDAAYKQSVSDFMTTMGLKYQDLGSFSTQSALETALNTMLNGMETNSTASIRFAISAAFGVFQNGVTYICDLRKGGSATYASISLHGLGINAEIIGNKASTTWTFQKEPTRAEVDALNSKLSDTAISTGSIDDIVKTGIYYVGNAVTGKPNGITGAGTGGMLIVMYANADNYVKVFLRNTNISSQFAYVKRVNGGVDMGWTLIK